jgi:4-amino-4-deoxy-L-arabinose transferase-like glycosyltransferase
MKVTPFAGLIILLIIIAYPIFWNIDYYPIRLWDESRVAINAYEMHKTGNWIVTTYNWEPDMWNTKPPLLIWIQVLFIKLFGLNDLSIRMVSPLAALGTCIFLYWFFIKKFNQPWMGIMVCLILVTSKGYIRLHGTRTGEYDSLMVMFTTMYALYYFLYLEDDKKKYLYGAAITLTLAVLTKGIAALLFMPALFIFTLFRGKIIMLVTNPHFYIGIAIFAVFGVGYYFLREHYNPGFIEQVRENEFGGRYLETDRTYENNYLYYYKFIQGKAFGRWLVLMAAGAILGLVSRDKLLRRLTLYSILTGVAYFVVVSLARTKNEWYDMACYPFFAIVTAAGIIVACRLLLKIPNFYVSHAMIGILIVLITWLPYKEIIAEHVKPEYQDWSQENDSITFYIRDILKGRKSGKDLLIAKEGYQADMDWYQLLLKEKGRQLDTVDYKMIPAGERVIAYQEQVKQYIAANYDTARLDSFNTLLVLQINGRKP